MRAARTGFESVVLGDGTVLAVGNHFGCFPGPAMPGSERAERYDPATDRWTDAESLDKPRKAFAMVALADGQALVVGGIDPDDVPYSSTRLFDPGGSRWRNGPLLGVERVYPAAASLTEGEVIVASQTFEGGDTGPTTVEMLEPGTDAWTDLKSILDMKGVTLHALADGRVMATDLAAGYVLLFDPAGSRSWQSIEGPTLVRSPQFVPLRGGDVLAFGYEAVELEAQPTFRLSPRVERLDVSTNVWSEVAPMGTARADAMVTVLHDDRLLVAGGTVYDGVDPRATVATEIYDPTADAWATGPDLLEPRKGGHARALHDGTVLIFGGDADHNDEGEVPWCPSPIDTTERIYLGG